MTVGTSMKKISSLALLVRQLRWGSTKKVDLVDMTTEKVDY